MLYTIAVLFSRNCFRVCRDSNHFNITDMWSKMIHFLASLLQTLNKIEIFRHRTRKKFGVPDGIWTHDLPWSRTDETSLKSSFSTKNLYKLKTKLLFDLFTSSKKCKHDFLHFTLQTYNRHENRILWWQKDSCLRSAAVMNFFIHTALKSLCIYSSRM